MPQVLPWPGTPQPKTRPRRKLRLTLAAALVAGWITDGRRLVAERETAIRGIIYPEQGDDYRDKTKLSIYSYLSFPCCTRGAEYKRRLDALTQTMSINLEILAELRAESDNPDTPKLRKLQIKQPTDR
jgi:hypothetical protein